MPKQMEIISLGVYAFQNHNGRLAITGAWDFQVVMNVAGILTLSVLGVVLDVRSVLANVGLMTRLSVILFVVMILLAVRTGFHVKVVWKLFTPVSSIVMAAIPAKQTIHVLRHVILTRAAHATAMSAINAVAQHNVMALAVEPLHHCLAATIKTVALVTVAR